MAETEPELSPDSTPVPPAESAPAPTKDETDAPAHAGDEAEDAPPPPPKPKPSSSHHFHFEAPPDLLSQRYILLPLEPLPEFDTLNAKAIKAQDKLNNGRQLYALVCKNEIPTRRPVLESLAGLTIPNFNLPQAFGPTLLSMPNECRFVMVFEQPQGKRLSRIIAENGKFNERQLIRDIIPQLCQIIQTLQERSVCHGKINLDTIHYNESTGKITLAECFSEPAGYAQSLYFEPPDRALIPAMGRGDEDPSTDYFSLGMLIVHLLLGFNPVQKITSEEYIDKCLSQGIFNTVVGNREFPGMIEDLLKGVLADDREDRWKPENFQLWLGGKKYNLLRPTPPREAPRPYLFKEQPHFNRRHLAYSIAKDWVAAKVELREKRILRWIELSTKNPELAETLNRIVSMTGGETGRLATDDEDLISKSITALDPLGPIRLPRLGMFISGMGPLVAEAMRDGNTTGAQQINRLIAAEYVSNWADQFRVIPGFRISDLVWFIEKRKRLYSMKTMGFGLERLLYDLNPGLPCLSPMVLKHHVNTVPELLHSLNSQSGERSRLGEPFDKHILAFLSSKLSILQEIRTPVDNFPLFAKNNTLKALAFFAFAQRKSNNVALPALTKWFAERLRPAVELFHSRSLRKELRDEIERAIPKGNLSQLFKLLTNAEVITQDVEGFNRARARFARNARAIEELNQRGTMDERSQDLGLRIAMISAYGIFIATLLQLIQNYVRF